MIDNDGLKVIAGASLLIAGAALNSGILGVFGVVLLMTYIF